MTIVARMVTLEHDGIPGYMAHPEGPEARDPRWSISARRHG
jgi:hypothetical protein